MKKLHFCWTTFGKKITYSKKWPSRLRVKALHKHLLADFWGWDIYALTWAVFCEFEVQSPFIAVLLIICVRVTVRVIECGIIPGSFWLWAELPGNKKWRYIVMSSLIGSAHTQNDPCYIEPCERPTCIICHNDKCMITNINDARICFVSIHCELSWWGWGSIS